MKITNFLLVFSLITVSLSAQRLESGTKAPNCKITDIKGNSMKLSAITKKHDKVLLCFMRPVWCPVCNARTHELIEKYDELKAKGCEVVVVYPTPKDRMQQYVRDMDIPFIVVSDEEEELFNTYYIEKSTKKLFRGLKEADGKARMAKGKKLYKRKYRRKGDKHGPLIPADFVIDQKRILQNVYYGEFMGDHLSLEGL